jgi:5-methylcytosine-specific restriction endonuclease McrA
MKVRELVFETSVAINAVIAQERVLVLNRSFVPIHITNVKRAVNLLCLDIAHGVDNEYQTYAWEDLIEGLIPDEKKDHFYSIRTVVQDVPVPKVLMLRDFDRRPPQSVKFSRGQIFLRDRNTCQYCAKQLPRQKLNLDHVVPRTQGGKTTWENVVASCHYCNRRKGGRTPSQAGMKLLNQPYRPKISPILHALTQINPSWEIFLFTKA